MAKATEFCIGLHNKPGTLAKLCGALKRAKVNIDAVSVSENAECCWVRMVASPAATTRKVLTKARYHFCVQPVLTLPAHNRPGELERVASRLAKAGVNDGNGGRVDSWSTVILRAACSTSTLSGTRSSPTWRWAASTPRSPNSSPGIARSR